MYDLHCHILPAIDDGATDVEMALEMARQAEQDGIKIIACTPHIYPGMYENTAAGIRDAITKFQKVLDEQNIDIKLVEGADVHVDPDLINGLKSDRIPTLNGSRYFLLEPPHHIAPPNFEDNVFEIMVAGYIPLITHPERLSWVETHYDMFTRLSERGAWIQITAGVLTGRYGRRTKYWADKFISEGHCMVLASDAHHPQRRPLYLAEARDAAAKLVGATEAEHMVVTRPRGILDDVAPELLPPRLGATPGFMAAGTHTRHSRSESGFFNRMLRGLRAS